VAARTTTWKQWASRAYNPDELPLYADFIDEAFQEHSSASMVVVVSRLNDAVLLGQDPQDFSFYQWRVAYIDEQAICSYPSMLSVKAAIIKYDYEYDRDNDDDSLHSWRPIWVRYPTNARVYSVTLSGCTSRPNEFMEWARRNQAAVESSVHKDQDASAFLQQSVYCPNGSLLVQEYVENYDQVVVWVREKDMGDPPAWIARTEPSVFDWVVPRAAKRTKTE
jgi:hypothetical protein